MINRAAALKLRAMFVGNRKFKCNSAGIDKCLAQGGIAFSSIEGSARDFVQLKTATSPGGKLWLSQQGSPHDVTAEGLTDTEVMSLKKKT
jgi:hypothetical protein